ncbi:hypothetical protein [Algoriphagus sp.]|uniref:hypothetical protein n=1 Tax=Algoriphagus sp. TaxID=1872435 RepID=UPI002724B0F5|nr:hypothetical protein [Algoriphagus sp.]MDO8967999.1 hypothetical protein [Algoriphagus sp.]MDP3199071.1 hypothetical protein [Algoriphagus sp.]
MKSTLFNPIKGLTLFGLLLFASCEKEESLPSNQVNETEETAQEVDLTTTMEDIDEVTLSSFQRNGFANRSLLTMEEDLCEKVKIEWLPGVKKMIIDFGQGCTSPRGVTRKGKIIVTYTGRYWSPGSVITSTFENFYIDDRKIEGVRVITNQGFNENDKFFTFKIVMEGGKITWPDGTFRTVESRHVKRIFLPNGDRGVIYKIAGSSKGVNRNGNDYLVEITTPLLFSERCIRSGIRIPSAGVMVMRVRSKDEIKIDFGTDACDRIVTITRGGETKTVTLPVRL